MQLLLAKPAYRSALALLALSALLLSAAPARADAPALGAPVARLARSRRQPAQPNIPLSSGYSTFIPWARQERGLSVDPQSRQQSRDFYLQHYLASNGADASWTGSQASCTPGDTSQSFQQAVLRRINYFRAMAGVPADVSLNADSNRKAQAAALMMSVNHQLSHSPPSSWLCYSADGADGAGSSDLYLGVYGPDAVSGYIKDPGASNSFVGHRRWVLYPQTQEMGSGDIPPTQAYPAANALFVFDAHLSDPRPLTREAFVAWPPPGYVPYQVVFPRWSFAYDGADFSAATVTMQSNGASLALAQAAPATGYGENTLVWIPLDLSDDASWPGPAADTRYTVGIHNVFVNGQSQDFAYDVVVFNPEP